MTSHDFAKRLKEVNPALRVHSYGNGISGIFLGSRYLIRLPQGEITQYSVFELVPVEQYGRIVYDKRLTRRGRAQAADILYANHYINYDQRNFLAR